MSDNFEGFPLSPQQERLLQAGAAGPAAQERAEIVAGLRGSLDRGTLTAAVDRVVARHEILRTTFPPIPGMTLPLQVIQAAGDGEAARLRFVDLAGEGAEGRFTAELDAFRGEAADLSRGPLLRVLVVRMGEGEHRLALDLPALCADREALEILLSEIAAAYGAVLAGGELEGEVLQYADLAEWQRELLESEEAGGLSLLAGRSGSEIAEILYAPLPFETAAASRPGLASVPVPLASGLAADLERAAAGAGVEMEALLLACWQIALARVAGRRGIVGVTCNGRRYEGLDSAVGLLAKTLPVAFDVTPAAPLRELAAAAQAALEEARAVHEYFSPSRLPADPATAGQALIPIGLDVHRAAAARRAGGLVVETLGVRAVHDRFRLRLRVVLFADRIEAEIEHERGRYDRTALLLLAGGFARLLEQTAASTQSRIDSLDPFTGAERHRLLVELNDTAQAGERLAAHRRFERAARLWPESPALVAGDAALTYGELDARADRLARRLSGLGVGPGSLVGVFFQRSFEMVTAVLAVLKAGGAYLPLDPAYPAERLAFMLADAEVRVLLTGSALAPLLPAGAPRVVLVDSLEETAGAPQGPLPSETDEAELAYVIYTSGSTGQPKGTLVHHGGLANYLDWCAANYRVEEGAGSVLHSSLGFDLTVTSLFPALAAGRTVFLAPAEDRGDRLGEVLAGLADLSLVKITPAHLGVLGETMAAGEAAGRTRLFVIGGEALRWESLRFWRTHAPGTRLVNEYGPTETVVGCAVYEVRADDPAEGAVPIGRPIDNSRLYVLDEALRPVPAGIPGELYIGGAGVARGYLGRPELTAERFVPDGLSGVAGERLYRTGDLVRHRADGELEFLGRTDGQVKLRGFRIELGEIEAALAAHPAVKEAVVVLRREPGGAERLVAYLTWREERPAADDLRRFLARTLPEHMLPSAYEVLPSWPLTVHGKIDRRALPEPSSPQGGRSGAHTPPATFVEEVLANIWGEVLRVGQVGVHDNFFQLGGDSILSIEVLARCRQFGLIVSPQKLFQNPTVRGLSLQIAVEGAPVEAFEPTLPFALVAAEERAALPDDAEDAYPLTRLQAGMLFHSFFAPGTSVYHEIVTFHLRAPFDAEAMERALGELIARHPVLRTSFHLTGYAEPLQVVHRRGELRLDLLDLTARPAAEQEAEIAGWMQAESRATFEWTRPSQIRFTVHRRSEDTFQLSLSYHHSIVDGWSVASLLSELFVRYDAALRREVPPVFPTPEAAFRDFVAAERRAVESAEQQRFWTARLADAEPVVLPRWQRDGGGSPGSIHKRFVEVSAETGEGLARCARAEGVLVKNVLFAALVKVLGLLADRDDIMVGVVVHARPQALAAEQIAGLFLNSMPLRLRMPAGSWGDLVRAAFAAELETIPYQAFPLAEIQRLAGVERLFEVVFNFVHFHAYQAVAGIPGLEVLDGQTFEETNFPLSVIAVLDPAQGRPHVRLEYDAGRFADAEIELLSGYFERALATLAHDPAARHAAALLLSPAERQQALFEWNDTAAVVEARFFHEIVAARAAIAPAAEACVADNLKEGSLSYRELDERASAVASGLSRLGIHAGAVVGLCAERGPGLLAGFLGILKAGGVYLPLDPSYPQDRLAFMLEDAGAELLLTEPAVEAALPPLRMPSARIGDLTAGRAADGFEVAGPIGPESLAYVIYTSGSTGTPKGVAVTHRGLSNLVAAQRAGLGIGPEDRILQLASPGFDSSIAEMAMTLAAGATLVFAPREELISGTALASLVARHGVTRVTFSPSMLAALESGAFPSLRVVKVAGEACPAAAVDRWAPGRRFLNLYGPTEATVWASLEECAPGGGAPAIGRPVANVSLYVLGRELLPVPAGVAAELCIAGPGVARGYLGRPELTADRFLPDPWSPLPGARLYRTGDLVRRFPDGRLDFLGRIDRQVKIRGFRIELGEIEAALRRLPAVVEAVVLARGTEGGAPRLVAYLVTAGGQPPAVEELREALRRGLPEHMLPAAFVTLSALPLTPSGKLDRAALPDPAGERPLLRESYAAPRNAVEREIAGIWREVLGLDRVGRGDNFFDLGGHSLLILRAQARLREALGADLPIVDLFTYPTVEALAGHVLRLRGGEDAPVAAPVAPAAVAAGSAIAVLGMAGRFPQAPGIAELWELLRTGTEAVSFFSQEELRAAGVDEAMLEDPRYVPAKAFLDGVELFDAAFFGFTPREAEIMDPQQRLFLECAWEALEAAGHGKAAGQRVGVFAGSSMNSYWFNLLANPEVVEAVGSFQTVTSNDKDFLATRVSYKLGLTGPSLTVQTACSTSLVAVHTACQALRAGECDMALAGGVSVRLPQKAGYLHLEGGIDSPDGHCRAFDAAAQGTVGGNGVGVVVLKRLAEALADGDPIRAVIAGSAINNDGAGKVGFTAPSVDGQAQVIRAAHQMAGIEPRTVTYVEAHGTGTPLGDPIEIAALTRAFAAGDPLEPGSCAIGSIKTNLGHLDAAAGVTGLIKAVLQLERRELAPSLHFQRANPQLGLAESPFRVNTALVPWEGAGGPLRAGVSSFGIGGTNAHVVLEEAPRRPAGSAARPGQLLILSARSEKALERMTARLAGHFESSPPESSDELADVAYTLQVGRTEFPWRRALVAASAEEARRALTSAQPGRLLTSHCEGAAPAVVFLLSGQGSQYAGMAAGLYRDEPRFRHWLDLCAAAVEKETGMDPRRLLTAADPAEAEAIHQTEWAQPALFAVEYALARFWMELGVVPDALLGHSVGELVAACLAGVFSLDDAAALVAARGRLVQQLPAGSMLAVALAEADLTPRLPAGLALAAVNAPDSVVVSGPSEEIDRFERELRAADIECRRLRTSHAFHSAMMEPALAAFAARVAQVERRAPRIPFLSNVTGTWITDEQAVDPAYWSAHLRSTVRFAAAVEELAREPERLFLEVGPGHSLANLVRRHPARSARQAVLSSLRPPSEAGEDREILLGTLGRLWLAGQRIDWTAAHAGERRLRVALPTYPFERRRFWLEEHPEASTAQRSHLAKRPLAQWFYEPSWRRSGPLTALPAVGGADGPGAGRSWWILADRGGVGEGIARLLDRAGHHVVLLAKGESSERLAAAGEPPRDIVHCWSLDAEENAGRDGVLSLVRLARALAERSGVEPFRLRVVTRGAFEVTGGEPLRPEAAMLLGPTVVLPQENPGFRTQLFDLAPDFEGAGGLDRLVAALLANDLRNSAAALRGNYLWHQAFEPATEIAEAPARPRLRSGGVYLITGGLGRVGLALAGHLARVWKARLVLVGRSAESAGPARIAPLLAAGAEVELVTADAADRGQMERALRRAEERFGALHGVIHAAGEIGPQTFRSLQELDEETFARQLRGKVDGALVLADLLAGRELEVCVLISSLAGVLGGLGFTAYAAANAFLDALAHHQSRLGATPWLSLGWDAWSFPEEGVEAHAAITPSQGAEAFERALGLAGARQVLISMTDLAARLERSRARIPAPAIVADGTGEEAVSRHPRPGVSTDYVAPRDETERRLAALWQSLLGIGEVGVEDSFFELGGHSLLATQLLARIRESFRVSLPFEDLFARPTVAGIAERLRSLAGRDGGPAVPPILPVSRAARLPLSHAQQRLWLFQRLEPESAVYNVFSSFRLSGRLDPKALAGALAEIVRRHEVLRTVFGEAEGVPFQDVAPAAAAPLPLADLTALPRDRWQAEARERFDELARHPFDLARGPLFRPLLVRLGPAEHLMLLAMHHIVCDAWSVGVFNRELMGLYESLAAGRPAALPDLAVQYADYAVWQRDWLESGVQESQLAYWTRQLSGLPRFELPADRPRPPRQTFRGATHAFVLPAGLSDSLRTLGQRENVTLFMLLLAGFQAMLFRYTGQSDLAVGTNVTNRGSSDLEGLIGFFVNNLVLRCDLSGNPSFRDLLHRVRSVALEAYAHQDLPFDSLVEEMQRDRERDPSRPPLFQVLFVLQNTPGEELSLPGLEVEPFEMATSRAAFDLLFNLYDGGEGVRGAVEYNVDLYEPGTIARLCEYFETVLLQAVSDPDLPIESIELAGPGADSSFIGDFVESFGVLA